MNPFVVEALALRLACYYASGVVLLILFLFVVNQGMIKEQRKNAERDAAKGKRKPYRE